MTIPSHIKAIRYNKPKDFELVQIPVPEPAAHEILIKGTATQLSLVRRP